MYDAAVKSRTEKATGCIQALLIMRIRVVCVIVHVRVCVPLVIKQLQSTVFKLGMRKTS